MALSRKYTQSDVRIDPVSFTALADGVFLARHGADSIEGTREQCVEWLLARAHAIETYSVRVLRKTAGELIRAR